MRTVWLPGDLRVDVRVTAEESSGAFSLLVDHPRTGWALPPHRHRNEAETIHVLEGRFETTIEGERIESGPGETIHVPKMALHSGSKLDEGEGRRILVFSPGGLDRFFLEAGRPAPDAVVDMPELIRLAGAHGWLPG